MSVPLTINGVVFNYPVNFDTDWGINATSWAQAVTAGMLQKAGGSFPLTADVNFGGAFGIIAPYFTSHTALPASAGVLRLATGDAIEWRNSTNTGNNVLNLSGDNLIYNGSALVLTSLTNTHIFVGNVSNTPTDVSLSGDATITNTGVLTIANNAITNVKVSTSAAIARSKLASGTAFAWLTNNGSGVMTDVSLSANLAVVTDTNGLPATSSTTSTELGYVHGVTSAIQTQLNTKAPTASPTFTGTVTVPNGVNPTDAVAFGQLPQLSMPYARGIHVSWLGNSTNHLLWTDAILEDSAGNKVRNFDPTAIRTLDITTSGLNGLDTGSVAASTFYYIWIISDGTTFNGLYSLSQTAPTMPGGYTYKILVGAVLTDGSSHIIRTMQNGQYIEYTTAHNVINDTTNNGTTQTLTISDFVPPTVAWRVFILVGSNASYSDTSNHSAELDLGSLQGGSPTPILVWALTGKTPVNGTYIGWMNTINELPAGAQINWQSNFDTTNLVSFSTSIFVAGYQLTNLFIS